MADKEGKAAYCNPCQNASGCTWRKKVDLFGQYLRQFQFASVSGFEAYNMLALRILKVNKWYRGLTEERLTPVLKRFGEGTVHFTINERDTRSL
jgi:hypothetical protein